MRRRHGTGLGLVAAIFLIMVVALLAVAVARTVRTGADVFAQDVVAHRAFLAAESGAQLALNRLYPPQGVPACADRSWTLAGVGLGSCTATIACRQELVGGASYYTLESAGRCESGGVIAERVVLVRSQP